MATAHRPRLVEQMGFDEQQITDPELESALEDRQKARDSLNAVRKAYDESHETAMAEVAKLELPEGGAVRVGRFRIARQSLPARAVSFETKASSRVRISLWGDD